MSQVENLTPFAAVCLPSMSCADEPLSLVVVSGRFEMPPAGVPWTEPPPPAEDQGQVRLADENVGEADALELVHEGQGTHTRPGTDLYLHGSAWAAGGKPTPRSTVGPRATAPSVRALGRVRGGRRLDRAAPPHDGGGAARCPPRPGW